MALEAEVLVTDAQVNILKSSAESIINLAPSLSFLSHCRKIAAEEAMLKAKMGSAESEIKRLQASLSASKTEEESLKAKLAASRAEEERLLSERR